MPGRAEMVVRGSDDLMRVREGKNEGGTNGGGTMATRDEVAPAAIPREVALRLCTEIQHENRGKWYTSGGMMCRGCVRFSHGDPAKMCFSSKPDNRGCYQVNARYERLPQRGVH